MSRILDRILAVHHDPKQAIIQKPFTDKEISVPILGHFVEEDEGSWFIRHNGELIAYCSKHSEVKPESDGIHNLELILTECWARYTKKAIADQANFGYKV